MPNYLKNTIARRRRISEGKKKLYTEEAQRLCRLTAQNFTLSRIYLFGSLTNSKPLSVWSDIDLAVEGLPEADYFKLIAFIQHNSNYKIDIKPYESLPQQARDDIRKEGVLIYEKR